MNSNAIRAPSSKISVAPQSTESATPPTSTFATNHRASLTNDSVSVSDVPVAAPDSSARRVTRSQAKAIPAPLVTPSTATASDTASYSQSASSSSYPRNSPFSGPPTPTTSASLATTHTAISSSTRSNKRSRPDATVSPEQITAESSASVKPQASKVADTKGKRPARASTSRAAKNAKSATNPTSAPFSTELKSAATTSSTQEEPAPKRQKRSNPATAASSSSYSLRPRLSQSDTNMSSRKGRESFGEVSDESVPSMAAAKAKGKGRTTRTSRAQHGQRSAGPHCHDDSDASHDEGGEEEEETVTHTMEVTSGDPEGAEEDVRMQDAENTNAEAPAPAAITTDQNAAHTTDSDGGEVLDEDLDEDEHHDDDDEDDEDDDKSQSQDDEPNQYDEDDEDEDEGDGEGEGEGDGAFIDDEGASPFGMNLRAMAGYMSGLSGRFKSILTSIRNRRDPSAQLAALQQLAELLSISNEDTLAGYFPTEAFVKELVYIMGGSKPSTSETPQDTSDAAIAAAKAKEEEEDAMAAAIAAASGLNDNGETMLLACRCLANLIEALPYAAHSVVSNGAIPVLNSKLMEIEFIDLAEQVLQTLEKISQDYPGAIVKEGGLMAMLQYLDFFNMHVQRTAVNAAANCCRRLSIDSLSMVTAVLPIIQNVLSYSDQRLVESACRCVVRIVESYRHHPHVLEQILSAELIAAVNSLLLPTSSDASSSSASTTIGVATYTDVLKAFGIAAKASPQVAVTLLENSLVETLYHLLTGLPAPSSGEPVPAPAVDVAMGAANASTAESSAIAVVPPGASGDGTSAIIADVAVLQNLASRPKEQVQEALSLVAELLPPLPRDGVFDSRAYSERAYLKKKSAERKAARAAAAAKGGEEAIGSKSPVNFHIKQESVEADDGASSSAGRSNRRQKQDRDAKDEAQDKRIEVLKSRSGLVKRFTQLVLPTLVEVYAASVALHVRNKAILGILKCLSFVEPEALQDVLSSVPLASFIAAMLSSQEHPSLVLGALQMVELLTSKLPNVYTALLRREGVMWEIDEIASATPSVSTLPKSSSDKKIKSEASISLALPGASSASEPSNSNIRSEKSSDTSGPSTSAAAASSSGIKPATPSPNAEAESANIWRARTLRDHLASEETNIDGAAHALEALDMIKKLVNTLEKDATRDEKIAKSTVDSITALFTKPDNPISSFELLRSGLVEGLYSFATGSSDAVPSHVRRRVLMEAFMTSHDAGSGTAASALVRRLQESLSRLENFGITTTISSGPDDSRRNPTASIGRQLRLRLQAEDPTNTPRNCNNIIVTIHAIASFHTLHDYLLPKVLAGAGGGNGAASSSGLSGVLAAMAAAAGGRLGAGPGGASSSGKAVQANDSTGGGGASANTAGASTSAAPAATKPRRSSRLRGKSPEAEGKKEIVEGQNEDEGEGKQSDDNEGTASAEASGTSAAAAQLSEALGAENWEEEMARQLLAGLLNGGPMDDEEQFSYEYDEEVYDEEMDDGPAPPASSSLRADEQTINVDVAKDGSKLELKTPNGTRIPTPLAGQSTDSDSAGATSTSAGASTLGATGTVDEQKSSTTSAAMAGDVSASKGTESKPSSYAAAASSKPEDWHLEFSMGSQPIRLKQTIYGAVHDFETDPARAATPSQNQGNLWGNVYTVKFKKVAGPARSEPEIDGSPAPESTELDSLPQSLSPNTPLGKILQLLRVLHDLVVEWREEVKQKGIATEAVGDLSEGIFVNNKLTAKLNRQLEEAMVVASSCMPDWSTDLPPTFPFLFPFEARYSFLQSTAFGYGRLIAKWQAQHTRNNQGNRNSSSSRDDPFAFVGRLSRQKVRIQRDRLFESAFKVFELYSTNSSILEVEYFDEVGTGLGPTLEFYSLLSKEFARKSLKAWRDDGLGDEANTYVSARQGLFPAPISAAELDTEAGKSRLVTFKTLGQFVAKALLDTRIIDCNFSASFFKLVLSQKLPATMGALHSVDSAMAKSLEGLQKLDADAVAALELDWTLPGHPQIELLPDGALITVTKDDLDKYTTAVIEQTLNEGVRPLVRAFRQGFNTIFSVNSLRSFTADELVMLFGNTDEDWSETTLLRNVKPDHGLTSESSTFKDTISVMESFTIDERRRFLQWLTGSPKLPIGGFSGLHPQLTVVKRPHEAPLGPDDYLPSVMTCVNYLKMPLYSSREKLRQRVNTAMREGSTSFHLS